MDKGKHAQRHKDRTHRWTKENVHENTMTAVRDGQRRKESTCPPPHTHTHTQNKVLMSGNNMSDILSEDNIWHSQKIKGWW